MSEQIHSPIDRDAERRLLKPGSFLAQSADLLVAIRECRKAWTAAGASNAIWEVFADGILRDFRAGVSLPAIAMTAQAWADILWKKARLSAQDRKEIE